MSRRDRGRLLIVLIVVVAAVFVSYPINGKINLGLDLRGGSHIVLRAIDSPDAPLTTDSIERLLTILRNRIDQYGVTEPVIQREGTDRVIVDLPGVKNPEAALDLIGKTALLEFVEVMGVGKEPPTSPERKNYASDAEFEEAKKRYEKAMSEYEEMKKDFEDKAKAEGDRIAYSEESGAPYLLGKTYLTGKLLKNAGTNYDSIGRPVVAIEFNDEGAVLFAQATESNVGKQIAIVLDGKVVSAPVVQEPISGGRAQISGRFSLEQAQGLAIMLRAGALPMKVEILENRSVGPTLGADSIKSGVQAGLYGAALVFLFMIFYYRMLGFIADLALAVNIVLVIAALSVLGATLTMPGIAGMVLNIGMAVDGNVIIFERIREEMREGKTAYAAVDSGFRKAFRTIFDSNITTLIAAVVLFYFGSGPIRGFAVTLSIGVIASMFTAITVTRAILQVVLSSSRHSIESMAR